MRIIPPNELYKYDISTDFSNLEIFPESWTKTHSFTQYQNLSRPCSAFFLICTDVRVTFYCGSEPPISAGKGDLVWIPSGTRYRVTVESGRGNQIDTYTFNLSLSDENSEEVVLSDRITVLDNLESRIFEMHIKTLYQEIHFAEIKNGQRQRNIFKIKSEFYALLDAIINADAEKNDAYYPIKAGADALRNEWNKNRRIEEYADMCGVSPTYFYMCFRQWRGKSPVEYRNTIRLSNAVSMLKYTNMKINDISETIGFDDPFYFCRVFTKHFGVSPKNYRARLTKAEKVQRDNDEQAER